MFCPELNDDSSLWLASCFFQSLTVTIFLHNGVCTSWTESATAESSQFPYGHWCLLLQTTANATRSSQDTPCKPILIGVCKCS